MGDPKESPTVDLRVDPYQHTMSAATDGVVPVGDDREAIGAFDAPGDRFEERGELGRGGMGRVADVYDHALGRRVAVKHVLARDDGALRRFEREARITAQLEHPGIVPIYEAGRSADGTPYYVMRRVDGRPLEDAVHAAATLAQRLALVPSVLAACDAVAYAHARAIVHRDLKPTNILLGPFGETLVIDWGLARVCDGSAEPGPARDPARDPALSRAGSIAGTPGFMAPEQARGQPADARADVFALGATLFYVLSGEPPYAIGSASELIERVAAGRPPDWTRLPEEVPDDLRAIVAAALAGDPAARYADAGALAADLRRFVTGNLVAAHRYSALAQLRRFVRRHRAAVAVGAAGAVAIAVIATVAVRRVIAERDEATAARRLETERATDLTIAQARLLLEADPTRAVALVQPLALGARWREARDVLAAASARGVPWKLPSSGETWRAGVTADGHAFSVGGDGAIWVYDLRARTGRVAHRLAGPVDAKHRPLVDLLPGQRLAVFDGANLALIARDGTRRSIALAAPVTASSSEAGVLWWIDRDHHAWRLSRDQAVPIAVDDEPVDVRVAPDGERFAIRGKAAAWLVDGTGATKLVDERTYAIAWHSSGDALTVITHREGKDLLVRLGTGAPIVEEQVGRGWPDKLVVGNHTPFMQNRDTLWGGATILSSYGPVAHGAGLTLARDEVVVAGASTGAVELLDGARRLRVPLPVPSLDLVTANPASPYVLAVAGEHVLLLDLDRVVARRLEIRGLMGLERAGAHQALVTARQTPMAWLDLRTFARAPAPDLLPRLPGDTTPDAARAVLVDGDLRVRRVRPGTTEDTVVAPNAKRARFLDDHRLAVLDWKGRLAVVDLDAPSARPALELGPRPVQGFYARGDFIVATYDDDLTVRVELATGRRWAMLRPHQATLAVLAPDGRLHYADGPTLRSWELDGRAVPRHTLPAPITNLFAVDDDHVALDTDESGFVVELDGSAPPRRTVQLGSVATPNPKGGPPLYMSTTSTGRLTGLVAVPDPAGGARIVDGQTGEHWRVGQPGGPQPTVPAMLSNDGSVLFERRRDAIAVWPIDFARSPAATAVQAAQLTNAELAPDGTLRWR